MKRWLIAATLAIAIAACGSDDSDSNGSGGSAGTGATGGSGGAGGVGGSSGGVGGVGGSSGGDAALDATADAPSDASADASADASSDADAATLPLPGFGTILGDCGPIDPTEILSASPYSFETSLDFGTMPFDYAALSPGGKQIHDEGNLGGSSLFSEIFSYEVLYRCELATLLKTEGKIGYSDAGTKKTDLLVQIDGYKIGVSVTRAYAFPPGSTYSVAQAQSLLEGKLSDILSSSASVSPADAWEKQILHVLAYNLQHRDALSQAYPNIPAATRADTIVMVTVTDGDDAFIY